MSVKSLLSIGKIAESHVDSPDIWDVAGVGARGALGAVGLGAKGIYEGHKAGFKGLKYLHEKSKPAKQLLGINSRRARQVGRIAGTGVGALGGFAMKPISEALEGSGIGMNRINWPSPWVTGAVGAIGGATHGVSGAIGALGGAEIAGNLTRAGLSAISPTLAAHHPGVATAIDVAARLGGGIAGAKGLNKFVDKHIVRALLDEAPVKRASFKNTNLAKVAAARLLSKMYDQVEKAASIGNHIDVFDAPIQGVSMLGINKRRLKQVARGAGTIGGGAVGARLGGQYGGLAGAVGGGIVGAVAGNKGTGYLANALTD